MSDAIQRNLSLKASTSQECQKDHTENEIIRQLKEKFSQTTSRSEKMLILTVLLQSRTTKKIQTEFGVSNYMARSAKNLVKQKGILTTPNPRPSRAVHKQSA